MTNLEAFGGLLSEHSSIDSSRAALFFANLTFRALFVEHFLAARWVSSLDSGFRMPKILGKNFLVSLDIIIPSAELEIPAYPTHFTIFDDGVSTQFVSRRTNLLRYLDWFVASQVSLLGTSSPSAFSFSYHAVSTTFPHR